MESPWNRLAPRADDSCHYTRFTRQEGHAMQTELSSLVIGGVIFLASLISVELGISVAIIEIILGAVLGNIGLQPQEWMTYLAGFGGILLTFLAGTEIDAKLLKAKLTQSFLIGFASFLVPMLGACAFALFVAHWSVKASLIAGVALSTTSLAVVYSVLVETGLSRTELGKLLMAATFVTDMGTALALSILFVKPTLYTVVFYAVSIVVIWLATRFSHLVLEHPRLKNRVVEPEIKYIFLLLLVFIYFAKLGEGQAVLPAFVLGLMMSKHFREDAETRVVSVRLRTVAYAIITPMFFIVGGLRISVPLILSALGIFAAFFALKISGKFLGVFFLARKYMPKGSMYTTLLMSTGLTFGTIASVFGLTSGYIDQVQYSVLIGVVLASAVIPTFVAQKWFMPAHEEDIVEDEEASA